MKIISVVCLPYGSVYTCLNLECTSTFDDAIMVEFNAIENNSILTFSDKPFLIKDVNSAIVHNFFNNVVQAYEASVPSALAIKTSTYNLISHICKEKTQKYQKRFNAISPGIELLESDPLCKLSIDEIAQSCNVSTCYFRRLFKEYSGKTPLEYQMDLRLNMSKSLLESGEATLEYIAETLNFTSSSYFCRLFKKNLVLPQVNTKSVSIYQNSLNYQYRKPRLRKLLFNFYNLNRHLIGSRRLFFKIIFSNSNSNYRIFFQNSVLPIILVLSKNTIPPLRKHILNPINCLGCSSI